MAALTVGFRKHSGPTPADDMAAQIITDCGNFKQHGFCASPLFLQTRGPWFPNEMQDLLSTLDHWVRFLHSPGKTLLTLSLVQKWLGSPFPEDIWAWWLLMHWLQLQSTPCEALPSVWISFAWQYSQACSHPCCLCTFSYPNSSFQSTLHLICFDTALCKQPHLSVWMNEWMMHLYSGLLCIVVHPKHFTIIWGGLSSTTTSVQHPLGWCDGSHRTTAPVRSPHTSYRWRGERDRANQVDGDY